METMYYIGLDVHKRTISYCVKDGRGADSGRRYACHTLGRSEARRFSAVVFLTLFLRLLGN